ncbi:MAG: hypothetical protein U9O82_04955 [Thermodesulfobacteriota bacterium]|nr:hypothetical protein [Thermodesulfobacteriota bacterium]
MIEDGLKMGWEMGKLFISTSLTYAAADISSWGIAIAPDQNGLTIRCAEPTDMYGNMHDGQVTVDCSGIVDNHPIKVKAGCTIKHIELEMSVPRKFPISLRSSIAPNSVINIENCNFIDNLGGNFPGGIGGAINFANTNHIQVNISDCNFERNQARFRGGAINIKNGKEPKHLLISEKSTVLKNHKSKSSNFQYLKKYFCEDTFTPWIR